MSELIQVTPVIAQRWLATAAHNRRLDPNRVSSYVDALDRGEWKANPLEPIGFDTLGKLIQGQHRLTAVVKSGHVMPLYVVKDVPGDLIEVLDQVKPRTLKDQLDIKELSHAKELSSAAAYLINYRRTGIIGPSELRHRITVPQGLEFLSSVPGLIDSAKVGKRTSAKVPMSSPLATTLHYVFTDLDPDDADAFFLRLQDGVALGKDSPILVLRDRLFDDSRLTRPILSSTDKAALAVKAWNYWRRGQELRHLSWRRGGSKPEAFPIPE